ncbi:MAG: 4'-phosphopantetheinyl transferase superfamily protein [Verrucomicrobia bacterium]|nr:4'-phosphopantetheinyl transferase superfamily protein [Verrucomicrobiota bacterium]
MIEVWEVDLASASLPDAGCRALLSSEELERADRFHFHRDRRRFLLRRAALRLWLAARLGVSPATLRFDTGPYGKPRLLEPVSGFEFNASASGDRALLAAAHGSVGVDLEQRRPLEPDLNAMISRLAPEERQTLMSLEASERHLRFFDCWVRKEALVKAVGLGLSLSLETFEVPLMPSISRAAVRWPSDPVPGRLWRVTSLSPGDGWSGAVATDQDAEVQIRRWTWP